jgi:NAD-dependent dihydropyrimidine dehydrogenase PreA subunit
MVEINVDIDKCTGCGTCVDVCPVGCYELEGDKVKVKDKDECIECLACVDQCPSGCLSIDS